MLNKLEYKVEQRPKEAFYCSDCKKLGIELYYGFLAEPYSNPPKWNNTLKWGAGVGVEEKMVRLLQDNGITKTEYAVIDKAFAREFPELEVVEDLGDDVKIRKKYKQERVEMQRGGIQINGYIDAMTDGELAEQKGVKPNCPIEIKSVNNKNVNDIRKYEQGIPKDNYVGQLACYMDFLGVDTGYLFVASIDGLSYFLFECKREGDEFICGQTRVNLKAEYKRWAKLLKENIETKTAPEIEVRYKIPVDEVDWKSVSKGDISKARNNNKVIGDEGSWKIQYSNWKDKILNLQGVEAGYSDEELSTIKELTSGYTTWK